MCYFYDSYYIRQIEIPKDAKVSYGKIVNKADKLYLYPREKFEEDKLEKYINFEDKENVLEIKKHIPKGIREYIGNDRSYKRIGSKYIYIAPPNK